MNEIISAFNNDNQEVLEAYLELGMALIRADESAKAEKVLRQAVTHSPKSAVAQLALGLAYLNEERFNRASDHLQKAIDLSPVEDLVFRGAAYFSLGSALFRLGRYRRAADALEKARELGHESYDLRELLAFSLVQNEKRDGKALQKALEIASEAVTRYPNNFRAYKVKAILLMLQKKYNEALVFINEAVRLKPDDPWSITYRGEIFCELHKYEEAIQEFGAALKLDPSNPCVWCCRAVTLALTGRFDEAENDLNRNIEECGKCTFPVSMIVKKGWNYRSVDLYSEALDYFKRAIALDPNSIESLVKIGDNYRLMGYFQKALVHLNKALELDPLRFDALEYRGETYRLMKKYDQALSDFNQALIIKPRDFWVLTSRGETYRSMKRFDEALEDFKEVLREKPDYDWAMYDLAIIYQAMGKKKKAQDILQAAIGVAHRRYEEDPRHYRNTFDLALFLLAAGRFQEAEKYYHEALDSIATPNKNQVIKQAISILNEFLDLFPSHPEGKIIRLLLQREIQKEEKRESLQD